MRCETCLGYAADGLTTSNFFLLKCNIHWAAVICIISSLFYFWLHFGPVTINTAQLPHLICKCLSTFPNHKLRHRLFVLNHMVFFIGGNLFPNFALNSGGGIDGSKMFRNQENGMGIVFQVLWMKLKCILGKISHVKRNQNTNNRLSRSWKSCENNWEKEV